MTNREAKLPQPGEGTHGEKLGVQSGIAPVSTGVVPHVTVSDVQCNLPETVSHAEILEKWRNREGNQWRDI